MGLSRDVWTLRGLDTTVQRRQHSWQGVTMNAVLILAIMVSGILLAIGAGFLFIKGFAQMLPPGDYSRKPKRWVLE